MKAIVTVKLPWNPQHNPHRKVIGLCPVSKAICTDVTGQHHSYIESGKNLEAIKQKAKEKYEHITRIEVVEE